MTLKRNEFSVTGVMDNDSADVIKMPVARSRFVRGPTTGKTRLMTAE